MRGHSARLLQIVERMCAKDLRYHPEAFLFLLDALYFTVSRLAEARHVSGRELLEGIRLYALDQFGPLARQVLASWGVTRTEDFGHIVFALVRAGLLGKTEEDSIEDFKGGYDFTAAFDSTPLFRLEND